jgi:hypothetical protein
LDPQSLVEQLVSLPDAVAQRAFLTQHASDLDDAFAAALQAKADAFLHSDLQHSLQAAALLCSLPEFNGGSCHRTLRSRNPSFEIPASNLPVRYAAWWTW